MAPKRINVMRHIRLQLKTGFMKKEPIEYQLMKRYPPLYRDTQQRYHKVQEKDIPYYSLYEAAIEKNPLYQDEKVYPAYWKQEPQALTLAKKQYSYMQKEKLSEEEAYKKAVEYIDQVENEAYVSLKAIKDTLQNEGNRSFASDAAVTEKILYWREVLKETIYEELTLEDQGEIDYLLQTQILGWNEVDRERRMKDPVFVLQFEKLRETMFPVVGHIKVSTEAKRRRSIKQNFLANHKVNPDNIRADKPFYVEDYLHFFEKCRQQPDLMKWDLEEKDTFSAWIISTLGLKEVLDKQPNYVVKRYLDDMRAQFFPMVRYPSKTEEYETYTLADIKALLYHNDIGYKRQGEKQQLYVQRYYKIPALLFPKELFTTKMLADETHMNDIMSEEYGLLREITNAGLDESSLPEIKEQLELYLKESGSRLGMPTYGDDPTGVTDIDFSPLDKIMADDFDVESDGGSSSSSSSDSSDSSDSSISDDDGFDSRERWNGLVAKYRRPAVTSLEQERDHLYGHLEYDMLQEAQTEEDLRAFKEQRLQNEVMSQAKMFRMYEEKEAARRAREWKNRGVLLGDQMPQPSLSLEDKR